MTAPCPFKGCTLLPGHGGDFHVGPRRDDGTFPLWSMTAGVEATVSTIAESIAAGPYSIGRLGDEPDPVLPLLSRRVADRARQTVAQDDVVAHDHANPIGLYRPHAFVDFHSDVVDDTPRIAFEPDFERNMIAIRVEVPRPLTPEESRAYEERQARARVAFHEVTDALGEIRDPVSRLVLDLHRPRHGHPDVVCKGCDVDGMDAEQPEWPCSTVAAVAAHHGIDTAAVRYVRPEWVEDEEQE